MKKTSPAKIKRYRIRSALRQLWMRSPERAEALKRDKYTCQECGAKQRMENKEYVVKVQVHHIYPPNWDMAIDAILACGLFCESAKLITYDKKCHDKFKEAR